jgi:hypothetical protein
LYEAIPGPKRMVTLRGGDHNDLVPRDAEKYWDEVEDFIASLSGSGRSEMDPTRR